jgi:hypothetical protein
LSHSCDCHRFCLDVLRALRIGGLNLNVSLAPYGSWIYRLRESPRFNRYAGFAGDVDAHEHAGYWRGVGVCEMQASQPLTQEGLNAQAGMGALFDHCPAS